LHKDKLVWKYVEFATKRGTWKRFRRCIFTTLSTDENGQYILGIGAKRTDNLIITNIGNNEIADQRLRDAGGLEYFKAEVIVKLSHHRGGDELIHRSLKELATKEQLPFKSMGMNRAYYFLLVISHFIVIDFATIITTSAGYVILNVPRMIFDNFRIADLWKKCLSPPIIQFE